MGLHLYWSHFFFKIISYVLISYEFKYLHMSILAGLQFLTLCSPNFLRKPTPSTHLLYAILFHVQLSCNAALELCWSAEARQQNEMTWRKQIGDLGQRRSHLVLTINNLKLEV